MLHERTAQNCELSHVQALERHIAEALSALDDVAGWSEHRATLYQHLLNAQKKARDLEQRMRTAGSQ